METVLMLVFFLAFLIRTVRNTLYQVFLWQIKEYRFDRMLAHLKTWQGKRIVFGLVSLAKFALIGVSILDWPVFWLVVGIYLIEAGKDLWDLRRVNGRGWKRPVWTIKAGFMTSVVINGEILLALFLISYLSNLNHLSLGILTLDKSLAPGVAFLILILNIPTIIQRSFIINRAKKMIKSRPDLITIGITGSYGKTSTKEFLAQILLQKFKVLKTEGSKNTEIGVAQTIVEELKNQEVFVCEMGAYKIGEIRQICQICRPKIGIITGLNEQHLDLFGSLEKTMEAKYELIEALPQDGLAVFNGNNKYCLGMVKKAQKIGLTILYYCTMRIGQEKVDFYADKIKVTPERLEFEVVSKDEKQRMNAYLLGKQNVENILAAVAVAQSLGVNLGEISSAVKKLEAPEMTMRAVRDLRNVGNLGVLIDDTFNANPDGVLAAIEYMKVYAGKKILVLTPMIELGNKVSEAHQKVGKLAGEVCDLVILTNKNYYEDFIKGFEGNVGVMGKVWISQEKEAAGKIRKTLDEDGVAIFEGKESKRILERIKG